MEVMACDVHAYEIACIRVEAVNAWPSSARSADFAFVLKVIVIYEFSDELSGRSYAYSEVLAEISDALIIVDDTEPENLSLDAGILTCGITKE